MKTNLNLHIDVFEYIMAESVRFDPDVLREIMWQGRNVLELEENFDEDQELIEEDFDEEGRSCVRSLWAALAGKFCKQLRRWRRRIIKQPR